VLIASQLAFDERYGGDSATLRFYSVRSHVSTKRLPPGSFIVVITEGSPQDFLDKLLDVWTPHMTERERAGHPDADKIRREGESLPFLGLPVHTIPHDSPDYIQALAELKKQLALKTRKQTTKPGSPDKQF